MSELPVIVVGAGLSGLSAAHQLVANGVDVVVLEARDRVGGRTLTTQVGGGTFDVGGQWIGPEQRRMVALVEQLGIATFPTWVDGKRLIELDGVVSSYTGTIPKLGLSTLAQLQRMLWAIDRHAGKVDVADPGSSRRSRKLDRITVAAWLEDRGVAPEAVAIVESGLRVVLGRDLAETSMLDLLTYVRAAGGLIPLLEVEDAAQERRLIPGAQAISERLAALLGDRVRLGVPVVGITQNDAAVTVHTEAGDVPGSRVIVAAPTNVAAAFTYEPALPQPRRAVLDTARMGDTIKCLAVYDTAFWRDAGLSGEAVATTGPLSVTFDNTTHDGVPAIVGFCVGSPAREHRERGAADRRDAVLAQLVTLFGEAARTPTTYHEEDWSDDAFSGGCPVALHDIGGLAPAGAEGLREPTGRIHWAGTETATEWRGFLEGAVQAGHRAAAEITSR